MPVAMEKLEKKNTIGDNNNARSKRRPSME
jgi:hypothetical protein